MDFSPSYDDKTKKKLVKKSIPRLLYQGIFPTKKVIKFKAESGQIRATF